MRAVTRYSVIFFPSSFISNSATRAHFMPRTVFAASPTAFSAACAKLSFDAPTISMTFLCHVYLLQVNDQYNGKSPRGYHYMDCEDVRSSPKGQQPLCVSDKIGDVHRSSIENAATGA
jgi:hypothetical protein